MYTKILMINKKVCLYIHYKVFYNYNLHLSIFKSDYNFIQEIYLSLPNFIKMTHCVFTLNYFSS